MDHFIITVDIILYIHTLLWDRTRRCNLQNTLRYDELLMHLGLVMLLICRYCRCMTNRLGRKCGMVRSSLSRIMRRVHGGSRKLRFLNSKWDKWEKYTVVVTSCSGNVCRKEEDNGWWPSREWRLETPRSELLMRSSSWTIMRLSIEWLCFEVEYSMMENCDGDGWPYQRTTWHRAWRGLRT